MNRWSVRGWESSNQPQPDRIQEYDGFDGTDEDGVPGAAIRHMRAMVEKDRFRATCRFSEVVDLDRTIVVDHGEPTEYRRFMTVRAKER